MQKRLSYLLFFMFVFLISFPSLKAKDSITCKYEVPVFGGSGVNANPVITLSFKLNSSNPGIYMNNTKLQYFNVNDRFKATSKEKSGKYFITLGSTAVFEFLDMESNYVDSNGKLVCPDMYFDKIEVQASNILQFEGVENKYPVSVIKLYSKGESTSAKKLVELDGNGDVITGDKDNTSEKKVCKLSARAEDIVDNPNAYVMEIIVNSYKDGSYFIEIDGTGDDVKEPTSDRGYSYKYVWKVNSMNYNFIIGEREWAEIKRAFPYNTSDKCTGSIRLTRQDDWTREYYGYYFLSINPIDDIGSGDGVIIDGSYDPNEDMNFNPIEVEDKSGVCVDYLGVADGSDNLATLLDKIYTLIKLGSIVIVVLMSSLEFANSVTKGKDDLVDVVKRFAKRLIIMVIILMLPTFIDLLGNLFGIKDILCGIK